MSYVPVELKTDRLLVEINDDNLFDALDGAAGDRPDADELRGHLESFREKVGEVVGGMVSDFLSDIAADYVSENH
ncbi:hypothetical protein GCM10007416_31630 [Kroppenstedtia guangzhouensis]|uniref:Uncharacterized protein n=1 Tax=Kroppenstedtia guangzhouensis TaxID=1274356 RepID=A0ABQ1H224_9BACL|nr:hypothetical protein [Kroppenstedtia guangzhouensis]GGA56125.1 hypothetical protein GCM10007416_31630 [Kroppenstedtia guangzhouensis]